MVPVASVAELGSLMSRARPAGGLLAAGGTSGRRPRSRRRPRMKDSTTDRGRHRGELAERVPAVPALHPAHDLAGATGVAGVQSARLRGPRDRRGAARRRVRPARLAAVGEGGWPDRRPVLPLTRPRHGAGLRGQLGRPVHRGLGSVQRAAHRPAAGSGDLGDVRRLGRLLESQPAELAVGVPRHRINGRAQHLPSGTRLAGEQACRRLPRRHRVEG